ncbi:MAG TPA: DUF2914 domain-containing protein, partial [Psychromonas sp.]
PAILIPVLPILGSEHHKMNKPEKFTIRINFRKNKNQAPADESRCHYHWGRIIGVSLAVIVTGASLISAGSYYLNQDQIDSEQVKSATNEVAEKRVASPALMPLSSLKKDAVRKNTVPEETAIIKSTVADTLTEEAAIIKSAETDTAPEDTAVIKPAETDTAPEDTAVIKPPLADTASEETAIIKPALADTVYQDLFTQSQTVIFSANVTRFVISQAVEGNEPIGTISDIHFDDNNIATVYAYSDVSALKDNIIYYQWSLDGKNIAKIRVDVGSDRWRSYSSKFIQPDMHGEWKVELQNKEGENLASNQFHY